MTPAQTETNFLKLNEAKRKELLLKSLKDSKNGFLREIDLASDVGIDPEVEGWEWTELGMAFSLTLHNMIAQHIVHVTEEIVYLSKK